MERNQLRGSAAPIAMDQPILQAQMDRVAEHARTLDKIFAEMSAALDRLTNRPPREVGPRSPDAAGAQSRPSIEGLLNMHAGTLEALVADGSDLLARLNRAV